MKKLERHAVYNGDQIVGFRCTQCQRIVDTMIGDTCNLCKALNKANKIQIKELEKLRK